MNTFNINDQNFINSKVYKDYINDNPTNGYLKIRAFTANQAIPISGLSITVSKIINNNNVIFFEGKTNSSGIIEKITLPTPKLDPDNLDTPKSVTYEIIATYKNNNKTYKINMYENIYVVQDININPNMMGDMNGY